MNHALALTFFSGFLIVVGTHAQLYFQDNSNYVRNDVFRTPAFFAPSSMNQQESLVNSKSTPNYLEIEQDNTEVVGDKRDAKHSHFHNASEDGEDDTPCVIKKGQRYNLVLIKAPSVPDDTEERREGRENIRTSRRPLIFYIPYSFDTEDANFDNKRNAQSGHSARATCNENVKFSGAEKGCPSSDSQNRKRVYRNISAVKRSLFQLE